MRLKKRVEELEKDLERCNHKLQTLSDFTNKNLLQFSKQQDELEAKVNKQEETIKNLEDICRLFLAERMDTILGDFNEIFERGLKDLFSSEPAKKCKKGAKSSAEKCKKCGETQKTTKKTSKKENK